MNLKVDTLELVMSGKSYEEKRQISKGIITTGMDAIMLFKRKPVTLNEPP